MLIVDVAGETVIDLLASLPIWLQCLIAFGAATFGLVLALPYLRRLGRR